MNSRLDNPTAAFLSWFGTIPMLHRQSLARLFFLFTTTNSADFSLSPAGALERFNHYITAPDFTLRRIARLVMICSVFDLIMDNRERIENAGNELTGVSGTRNVLALSDRQWEKTVASWHELRGRVLNDQMIGLWLKTIG